MAEDWSDLADDYGDNDDIVIAKVDCTKNTKLVNNRPLCEELGVKGFPTLLYGDVGDLKEHLGQREIGDLRDVVEDHLTKPLCGVAHPELCGAQKKRQIEELTAGGLEAVDAKIKRAEDTLQSLETRKKETVDQLRKKYSEALRKKNQEKQDLEEASNLALMKQILKMKELEEETQSSHDEL